MFPQKSKQWRRALSSFAIFKETRVPAVFSDTRLHLEIITITIIPVYSVVPRGTEGSIILTARARTLALLSAVMFELQLHLFLFLYNQSIKIHPIIDQEERLLSQTHTSRVSPSVAYKEGTNWLRGVRIFWFIYMWGRLLRCRLPC